jgi:hopanoid biosynthesis associated RND transporter like protein HpnN
MIAKNLPFRLAFADYLKAFPSLENTFLVVIDSDEPELGREAAKSLAQSFTARSELFEAVYAPGTSRFFDDFGILYLDTAKVQRIAGEIAEAAPLLKALGSQPNLAGLAGLTGQMAQAAEFGAVPPAMVDFFSEVADVVTADTLGQTRPMEWSQLGKQEEGAAQTRWYVIAKPRLDYSSLDPAAAAIAEARQIVADPEIGRSGKVRVTLTGEAAVNAEEFDAVIAGASIAGTVSFVLVTLVIAIGLPAMRLIIPALAMLVLGFMLNAGFATLAVGELNMISVAFAVLFIGLGIDYAVHMLLRFAENARAGMGRAAAIAASADGTGPALALCTLTTSLAFLAFTPTDFAGMAQLGIIAAGGIVIAFVASLTLGQSWMTQEEPGQVGSMIRLVATVAFVALGIASLFAVTSARFDGDPTNLKDPESKSVIAFKDILQRDSGQAYAIQVVAASPEEARQLAGQLRVLPSVREVRIIDDLLPKDQENKLLALSRLAGQLPASGGAGGDIGHDARTSSLLRIVSDLDAMLKAKDLDAGVRDATQRLRDAFVGVANDPARLAARLPRLENALFAKLPETITRLSNLASTREVALDSLEPEVLNKYIAADGRWRVEVIGKGDMRDEDRLRTFVGEVRGLAPNATGAPVEITGAADVVAQAIRIACLAALGLVIIVLLPLLRRMTDIALVIAPIALSAILLVAYTVVFNTPFNFANVIVLPLLLGLGIDSAIHYVMRAREMRASHARASDVVATSTPRAVLISALTTIGSFGTLWLSPHRGMSSMGELLTIAIIITLISTLVVLPQLISWVMPATADTRG